MDKKICKNTCNITHFLHIFFIHTYIKNTQIKLLKLSYQTPLQKSE